jgi:hypothetical protein
LIQGISTAITTEGRRVKKLRIVFKMSAYEEGLHLPTGKDLDRAGKRHYEANDMENFPVV